MSDLVEKLLSNEGLRNSVRETVDNISDDELKQILRDTLTDDMLKEQALLEVDRLIADFEKTGELTTEELDGERQKLTSTLTSPEMIETLRTQILDNPDILAQIKEALSNPDQETINTLRDQIQSSTMITALDKLQTGIENGAIDATFWGASAVAERAVQLGSQSRFAKFLSVSGAAGKRIPGVAVIAAAAEGGFGVYQIANGEVEKGAVNIGGAVGGLGATLLAGAATAGAIAGAPVIVTGAVVAGIGVAGYYAGRSIVKAGYMIHEINETYERIDASFQPDHSRHSNLISAMARVYHRDEAQRVLKGAGYETNVYGRVDMDTMTDMLANPETSERAEKLMRRVIGAEEARFEQIMDDNWTWTPRWISFTDNQSNKKLKWEGAKMDARIMDSALKEMDGYIEKEQEKFVRLEAARAELAEALEPYNALNNDVKSVLDEFLSQGYSDHAMKFGRDAAEREIYMLGKRVELMNPENQEVIDNLTKLSEIAKFELAQWKTDNPDKDHIDAHEEREWIIQDLVEDFKNGSEDLLERANAYEQHLLEQQAAEQAQVKPEETTATSPSDRPELGGVSYAAPAFAAAHEGNVNNSGDIVFIRKRFNEQVQPQTPATNAGPALAVAA